MAYARESVPDFALANKLYVNAVVTFFTVLNGAKTAQKSTLYAAISGNANMSNPQTLDSFGKFRAPVYIQDPTIAVITGLSNVPAHETGVIRVTVDDSILTDFFSFYVKQPVNETWSNVVLDIPFDAEIDSVTAICTTGTCTVTVRINAVNLGGAPNSVSSVQSEVVHTTNNDFIVGDNITIVVSNAVSCQYLSIKINYRRN